MEALIKKETEVQQQPSCDGNAAPAVVSWIKDCNDEQIKTSLRYIMVLLGLTEKDTPDEVEKTVLLDFIREEYGNRFTPEELKTAFKWALSGKTEVDKSFYGKRFSCAYLSNFMEAFEKKKLEEKARQYNRPVTGMLRLMEDSRDEKQRDADRYQIHEDFVLKKKMLPDLIDTIPCFEHLKRIGKLDLSKPVVEQMRKEALADMAKQHEDIRYKLRDAIQAAEHARNMRDKSVIRHAIKRKYVETYLKSLLPKPVKQTKVKSRIHN